MKNLPYGTVGRAAIVLVSRVAYLGRATSRYSRKIKPDALMKQSPTSRQPRWIPFTDLDPKLTSLVAAFFLCSAFWLVLGMA